MTATQLFGAFNDNLYKQLMLLLAVPVGIAKVFEQDQQGLATIVFSLPFVLFSGFAGFLADRFSKQPIIVLAKLAEIVIMRLGAVGLPELRRHGLYRFVGRAVPDGHAQRVLWPAQVRHPARNASHRGPAARQRHHGDDDVPGDHFRHRGRRIPGRLVHRPERAVGGERLSDVGRLGVLHRHRSGGDR